MTTPFFKPGTLLKSLMSLSVLILLTSISVAGEVVIYTGGNSLLDSVAEADENQRLAKSQQVLARFATHNTLDHGIAQLIVAQQLNLAGRTDEALEQISTAEQLLTTLEQPLHLANAKYMRAMILAINQRQYQAAVPVLTAATTLLESPHPTFESANAAFNDLFCTVNSKLGSLYLFLKDSANAYKYLKKAEQQIQKTGTLEQQTLLSNDLATYYTYIGNNELAEQYLIKNYALASASEDHTVISKTLNRISRFYRVNNRYELAIEYGKKAIQQRNGSVDPNSLSNAYNTLAIAYEESGEDNLALVHYLNVIDVLADKPNHLNVALAQHNIGETYIRMQQPDKALTYLTIANQKFKGIGHSFYELTNNIALAKLFVIQEKYPSAIRYALRGLSLAKERKMQDETLVAHSILAKSYQLTRQPQLAIRHHNEISALNDARIDKLEQKLSAQNSKNNELELVALKQKVLALERSDASLKRNSVNNESTINLLQILSAALCFALMMVLVYHRRKIATMSESLAKSGRQRFSGLARLSTASAIKNMISNEFNDFKYLVVIDIPVLSQMLKHMSMNSVKQLETQWLTSVERKIASNIYHINDSTFIVALNVTDSDQALTQPLKRQLAIEGLLKEIIESMPSQLSAIYDRCRAINIGMVERVIFAQSSIQLAVDSTLELAMCALSASQYSSEQNPANNWTYLSPKTTTHSAMFSSADRNTWLQSIENNLIDIESNSESQKNIPWQSFTL